MEQNIKAGDSDKITRQYFDSLLIEMRHIDSVVPSTGLVLYGETFSTPIMTAALSHLGEGMVEMAKGALAANAVMWWGMSEEADVEAITATGARTIKIVKPYADNSRIFRQIENAEKCGALAVGMDIDHSFNGRGQHDIVLGDKMSPKTLEEMKSFIKATKLPFIIKGVLSEQDTYKALEAGAKGIVISHHHGIQDFAIPPLMLLPKIAKVVNGSIPIFVDCCIESGMDAFKALALGATAVSVGRALMGPVKNDGAKGVQKKIEDITAELAGAMARTCSPDIMHIDPSVIWKRDCR
ncbi:MAG: alpha-hydroxy acid oxidase [Bacillota bacterium]|nr:alpha-hydroxy acid oxidase [Bacillota bacterium]